ncbi:hypothetical protein RF11_11104 [Thelohanellus kitauei]|uniref:Uncharacterized protein n=1 Tax=Thelohanellus kitauei TaxID=669202 RepID=A0A0C2JJ89_THEKT|nr:hypothetical protein RF11_11104 [Thelohanellus kitauei]
MITDTYTKDSYSEVFSIFRGTSRTIPRFSNIQLKNFIITPLNKFEDDSFEIFNVMPLLRYDIKDVFCRVNNISIYLMDLSYDDFFIYRRFHSWILYQGSLLSECGSLTGSNACYENGVHPIRNFATIAFRYISYPYMVYDYLKMNIQMSFMQKGTNNKQWEEARIYHLYRTSESCNKTLYISQANYDKYIDFQITLTDYKSSIIISSYQFTIFDIKEDTTWEIPDIYNNINLFVRFYPRYQNVLPLSNNFDPERPTSINVSPNELYCIAAKNTGAMNINQFYTRFVLYGSRYECQRKIYLHDNSITTYVYDEKLMPIYIKFVLEDFQTTNTFIAIYRIYEYEWSFSLENSNIKLYDLRIHPLLHIDKLRYQKFNIFYLFKFSETIVDCKVGEHTLHLSEEHYNGVVYYTKLNWWNRYYHFVEMLMVEHYNMSYINICRANVQLTY